MWLALLTSLLLTLSFPRFGWSWLIAVALTPLLLASARETRPMRRFLAGWLAGAGTLFGVTDWIRFVVSFHGGLGTAGGWAVFLLFCLAKGFYFGVFALLAGPVMRLWWAVPAVAALWVGVDITFGSILFQWVTLGNAGADMSIPMRLAPLTGVHGLSFVFVMMSTALALVLLRRPRWQIAWLLLLPMLILLPPLPEPEGGTARAVVLQPNIDETQSWTQQSVEQSERELALISMRAALRARIAEAGPAHLARASGSFLFLRRYRIPAGRAGAGAGRRLRISARYRGPFAARRAAQFRAAARSVRRACSAL